MVSSLLAGIRFPSLINEGLDARGTDPNENADPPQKPGRKLIGMPAGFISEWWPASNRNGDRLHVGIPGRNKSESALQRVVGSDLLPMNVREAIVGQGLVDGLLDEVGCFAHLACPQVADDRLCLVVGGLPALLGVNGLEHMAHPGRRDVAKDVAVEMHHAALVARLRQEIRHALDKAPAGVGNDQLHALQAVVDQVWRRNADQPDLSSLAPLADPQDLAKSFRIDGRGHQQRNIADLAGPAALHDNAVEVKR
jgi:hypothetical protein